MIGDVESIDRLREAVPGANDVELIPNIATALGLLGARDAVPKLAEKMEGEENEFIRQSLLYSLGLIGDTEAIEPLSKSLADQKEVPYVRAYAAVGLGLLADQQPVRAIARISTDSNYTITWNFLTELFRIL